MAIMGFMAIICFNGNLGFYLAIMGFIVLMSFYWQSWVFNGDYEFLLQIVGF